MNAKLIIVLITILAILTGCAKLIPINESKYRITSNKEAINILERAYYQQPKNKPQHLLIETECILLSYGTFKKVNKKGFNYGTATANSRTNYQSNSSNSSAIVNGFIGGTSSGIEQIYEKNERIYFDSIDSIKLYSKSNYYVVSLDSSNDRPLDRVYIFDVAEANEFISAIKYLKQQAE